MMNFLIELFQEIFLDLLARREYPRFIISTSLSICIILIGMFVLSDDSPWRMLGWPIFITGAIAGIVWEKSARKQKEASPEMLDLTIKRRK